MSNILIRGCPGTGKTFFARAVAYYMCKKNMTEKEAFDQNPADDAEDIEKFVNDSDLCEFIQVHPSMEFDDIVYGLEIKVDSSINISFTEKRVMKICNRACGKRDKYCVILDDINRADASRLLGNLLYAMEYRNQNIELPDGNRINIPDNVVLIFTENTLDIQNGLDLAMRRRMTYLKELKASREVVRCYYQGYISNPAMNLVMDIYNRVEDYVISYFQVEPGIDAGQYIPGHGMYIVARNGNVHFILDNIRQKIKYQVGPYLKDLYSMGLLKSAPDSFIEQVNLSLNVGIEGICPILAIRKKLVRQNRFITSFSLSDSRDYYHNTIVPAQCLDFRGMMECILDALILNGVFPYDVLMGSLLQNTQIAYVESLHTPKEKAAYLVERSRANRFMYETVRGGVISGTHAYYTMDSAATGRYASQNDTEEYVISYNDGRQDVEFIPLSGFRNHGFDPDSPELSVQHNTVNIMSAVHILLNKYLELYKMNIGLVMGTDPEYLELYQLIELEHRYLDVVKQVLKRRSPTAPRGDKERLAYYGKKVKNLRLLWYGVGDDIEVNEDKYNELVSGNALSIDEYEDLFNVTTGAKKTIKIKGVLKMVDLKDYQKIMENIGVRQMIFQGPPGTSKTFESKRFVLKQLKADAPSLSMDFASQEDISKDLDAFKLTDEDYENPGTSPKLTTGGWDLVQFHPSYGYEDFIRGIEVKIPAGETTPSYESVNRILGKIAEFSKAAADNAGSGAQPKFYLIVDEINRANLATVFGELIYGLEYRNSKVSTPYEVKEKATEKITKDIVLGKNMFILGTMNTADKSIDAIDYAIRRRFIFIDSPADRQIVLKCYQNISGNADENSIELLLFDGVQRIFDDERFFNNEYQKSDVRIGHTYFLRDRKRGYEDAIIEHFIFQVVPILREYVKDGILDVTESLVSLEHLPSEIHSAGSEDEQVALLSENVMLYIKEFGNLTKLNVIIDNEYIGKFIDDLCKEFKY
ncbi:MAG: AAA family ATPase [Ruminococcus sp.]|nr:AAA family ATPase [Ruminococcus sp.]